MKFWLVPYFLRNIWVDYLSHFWSFIYFSQSFSMEYFHAFWIELLDGWKQFGLEFEERGSRARVFLKTWRKNNFYRVAVGVIDRYYGDASSELVILVKFCVPLAVGHLWCPLLGVQTPFWSATRSTSGAGTCKDCWTIQLSTSDCSNAAYIKLLPLCSGRSIRFCWLNSSLLVSRALSIVTGCSRSCLSEVQLRQAIFLFLGWWTLSAT